MLQPAATRIRHQPNHTETPTHIEPRTHDQCGKRNSRKLLMMDILMSETCWAHKKWNKNSKWHQVGLLLSAIWIMKFAGELRLQEHPQLTYIVIHPYNKNQQDALFCSQFISIINLYMLRAGLLLIITRYYSVYTVIGIRYAFMFTGCWQVPC